MSGGRPKNKDEDFCPKCGKLGNPYHKGTTKNSSNDHYFYTWFRHVDRKRKDCYIENKLRSSSTKLIAYNEYNRKQKLSTTYIVRSKTDSRILKKLPLKEAHINKAFPVIIFTIVQEKVNDYGGKCEVCDDVLTFWHDIRCTKCDQRSVMWCPTCQIHRDFSDEIHPIKLSNEYNLNAELKRLKIPVLDKSKISWFLKKVQGNEYDLPGIIFLKELSDVIAKSKVNEKTIIIYGEKAAEFADHISSDNRCQYSSISYRIDKYGILEKLQKATNTREKQIIRYNYPSQTLF